MKTVYASIPTIISEHVLDKFDKNMLKVAENSNVIYQRWNRKAAYNSGLLKTADIFVLFANNTHYNLSNGCKQELRLAVNTSKEIYMAHYVRGVLFFFKCKWSFDFSYVEIIPYTKNAMFYHTTVVRMTAAVLKVKINDILSSIFNKE